MINNCENCGNELTGRRRRFCSSACKTTFSAREKKAARHSMVDFNPDRTCAYCERPFTTTFRYRFKTYCNESCKKKAKRERKRQEVESDFVCDTTMHKRTCKRCGVDFTGTELQVYCSTDCFYQRICPCCGISHRYGVEFDGYCSHDCKELYTDINIGAYKECKRCGAEFVTYHLRTEYCFSDRCRRDGYLEYYYANFTSIASPVECTCEECGTVFMSKTAAGSSYCGKGCARKADRRKRGGTNIQRAKAAGVAYEYFDEISVLVSYGWICYLCGENTPMELRGTYEDNAPEIEHIIPIGYGGTHTLDNVACACRRCNSIKSSNTLLMSLYEINTRE